jgi:hypothetical protein
MIQLLSEEGYTSVLEKYLFDGFSFCGALPVCAYLKKVSSDERYDFIDKFSRGAKFNSNERFISLKIMIIFLSFFIANYPNEYDSFSLIIRCIPGKVKTKSGNLSSELPSILEKYLIKELPSGIKLPELSDIPVIQDIKVNFCFIFTNAIREIKTENKLYLDNINRILSWLNLPNNHTYTEKSYKDRTTDSNDIARRDEIDYYSLVIENLKKYHDRMLYLEDKTTEYKKQIFHLSSDLSYAENACKKNNDNLIVLQSELKSERERYKYDLDTLRNELSQKEDTIKTLSDEASAQKSVLTTYSVDKQNSINEQLNKIAANLKTFYLNYKDSVDMEMTIDLGNDLRNLMSDIFKNLKKSGINTEDII